MGFEEIVNTLVLATSTNQEHHFEAKSQIICKPGSVIEDIIYLGSNSRLSSSG